MLEGDAETPSENRMIAEGLHHSDLLKIGHHGSRTSTTPPFLAAVSPSYAVISVGSRNLYGHPRREVLEELQSGHIRAYRTDTLGISTFYLDGIESQPPRNAGDAKLTGIEDGSPDEATSFWFQIASFRYTIRSKQPRSQPSRN